MKYIKSITILSLLMSIALSFFNGKTLNADADDMSVREVEALLMDRMEGVSADRVHHITQQLFDLCEKYDFAVSSVLAVIETESRFNKDAISSVGAIGLMQIMPSTAKFIAERSQIHSYRRAYDLHDPAINLEVGIAYLHYLRGKYGKSPHYLSAYNMGPTNYNRWMRKRGSTRPASVTQYVNHIHNGVYSIRRDAQNLIYAN